MSASALYVISTVASTSLEPARLGAGRPRSQIVKGGCELKGPSARECLLVFELRRIREAHLFHPIALS